MLIHANVKEELNEEEDGDVVDKSEEDFNFFKQFLLKYLKNNLKIKPTPLWPLDPDSKATYGSLANAT